MWQQIHDIYIGQRSQQQQIFHMSEQPIQDNLIEELCCSVCMCLFRNPVTILCGHTFCRTCLLNYTRTKLACPICRATFMHVSEHPPLDYTIANVVNHIRKQQKNARKQTNLDSKEDGAKLDHIQNLLLIDIRCNDILLPYTKLQSPTLFTRLQRFVVRQETPFNKFGVVSKICSMNQLRHNIYECTIQGKYFCHINNQQIDKLEEQSEEFFYRVCQAKLIYEDEEMKTDLHDEFLQRFMKIKDKNTLKNISKMIDPENLFTKNNPIASYYSIMKILAETDQKKYEAIISFDCEKRKQFLHTFFSQLPVDIAKFPNKLIKTEQKGRMWVFLLAIFLIFWVLIFTFNTDSSQL